MRVLPDALALTAALLLALPACGSDCPELILEPDPGGMVRDASVDLRLYERDPDAAGEGDTLIDSYTATATGPGSICYELDPGERRDGRDYYISARVELPHSDGGVGRVFIAQVCDSQTTAACQTVADLFAQDLPNIVLFQTQ